MQIKNGILEGVKVVPSPNKGGVLRPRLLIVHDTAGALNAAGSVSWLCNPVAKASAHFVVDLDGSITQLVSTDVKAWHAGKSSYKGVSNVNDFAVGIEFVNPGLLTASGASGARAEFGTVYDRKKYGIVSFPATNLDTGAIYPAGLWMPYPQAQLDAGLAIALALRERYGIQEVARHADISPRRKIDVGPQFPMRWFTGKLTGRQDDEQPQSPGMLEKPDLPRQGSTASKAIPGPAPSLWVKLSPNGELREWPSFFDSNKMPAGAGPYRVVDQLYVPADSSLPIELGHEHFNWWKVELPEGFKSSSGFGYILGSNGTRTDGPAKTNTGDRPGAEVLGDQASIHPVDGSAG